MTDDLVHRQGTSLCVEGDKGTVDREYFELWVEHNLVPVLGNFEKGEPRSVVVLDNCSIHGGGRVQALIEDAGAVVVWTAPYSPDLNPIEFCFHQVIYRGHA